MSSFGISKVLPSVATMMDMVFLTKLFCSKNLFRFCITAAASSAAASALLKEALETLPILQK
jgi:hypothetical protein